MQKYSYPLNLSIMEEEMKLHKYLILSIVVLSMVLLGACGGQSPTPVPSESAAPPTEEKSEPKSIAVVMWGPWDDNSWNEAAYNSLEALKAQGVKTAYSENVDVADAARVLREYADQGYDVVVAHSFSYMDAVFQVASEMHDTNFAWAGGINSTAANVADYDQPFYEAAYPIGVLAAHMSKTGKLGALYGADIPVCHAMGEAFLAGAQSVNPDATLSQTEVGDWGDVAKAKEGALAQADLGVDYWIECGEGPALGAIEAAKEKGGYATGYVGDMTANGPDVVLANLIWNMDPLFSQMLADTQNGSFANKFYKLGVKEGVMLVGYNEALKDQIPAEAIADVDKAIQSIISGSLVVPFIPEAK